MSTKERPGTNGSDRPAASIGRRSPVSRQRFLGFLGVFALLGAQAPAQEIHAPFSTSALPRHVIVPQARSFVFDRGAPAVEISEVKALVKILEQTASTTLEIALHNPGAQPAEAILLLPVPDGAVVHSFLFEGTAAEPRAEVLPADEARRTYQSIVQKIRDPALLEFAGFQWVRTSLFPIPASGRQRVRLTYENLLEADGERIDYVLPRSESLEQAAPWKIAVQLFAKDPISAVFSPSHDLVTVEKTSRFQSLRIADRGAKDPGAFWLSYLVERDGRSASLFAYPDPRVGGGYFLLMCGLPTDLTDVQHGSIRRDVVLVLDRSGSMAGTKLDQAKAAALQIIEGLDDGESFNIVDYGSDVSMFARSPVVKSNETAPLARAYLDLMRPGGGTNIHDALLEALRQEPREGFLPMALFLTDGLPTIGQTSESHIRELVEKGNSHRRRVFTFGVGNDVNVPLLDRVAELSKATSTYVLPDEDIEVKVAGVFRKLYGPVLTDATLSVVDREGDVDTRRVREVMPSDLPDFFQGDSFIVLGQYLGEDPLLFLLKGVVAGKRRTFQFEFGLRSATTRNAFVPRLWAARRIAYLADQIRLQGADPARGASAVNAVLSDPRMRELTDEILRLSTEFGILSEYTAFLATEGTDLSQWNGLLAACGNELDAKAFRTRHGMGAINQGLNFNEQKKASKLNYQNCYIDGKLERVEISNVQQICDRAFFRRGTEWIDSQIVAGQQGWKVDREVEFGSPEHVSLIDKLAGEGRAGMAALNGDIVMRVDGQTVRIRQPVETSAPGSAGH